MCLNLSVIFGELKLIKYYDFQEFSKLFISMLEERLSHQSSPLVKNIINEQFCGKYSYVTKWVYVIMTGMSWNIYFFPF
jgi:hypothetical protein